MKTLKRFFELMCAAASEVVPAAEHLCQCAKCSCNFDKTKAKSTDAGCSCPNCGTLLDEKGAAKVEDQAAKEIKADGDGDVDAKNATRQPALEAGGPGSGPHAGGSSGDAKADEASKKAYELSDKANDSGKREDHINARLGHDAANNAHLDAVEKEIKDKAPGYATRARDHVAQAFNHRMDSNDHLQAEHRIIESGIAHGTKASNATNPPALQAGFNGNQHKSAKELAAEHSVAADTASKVAASASKAARGQDPSNKEGLHDSAMTMHTAAKSLHELAAAKHRSAGEEDCAKDHDTAAAGHGDEIQAHKGVIEACGGVAARGNGAAGLEAGGPGSGRHAGGYTESGANYHQVKSQAHSASTKAEAESTKVEQGKGNLKDAAEAHSDAATAHNQAAQKSFSDGLRKGHEGFAAHHSAMAKEYMAEIEKRKFTASNATPAAGLQLDCSACVEAKNFKSVLNPIADGIIMYMPAGTHTITPSQNGRPVTVSVAIDASAADKLETQRAALESSGKKPFFSVQHSTQIAAFWPAEFFWDTRLDATGSLVEGVWARGEWTRAGREAVEGKDFRTFSPTFFVDAIRNDPNRPVQVVCNDEAKANMGALENDPAFQTISPLWAHDASAPGTPKPKPEGVTTEKLIVMVHDELRASNPDLQDVVNAMAFKYDMRVNANDVARALRGEALEAGGPGSGPHKAEYERADVDAMRATQDARNASDKVKHSGLESDHIAAAGKHDEAVVAHEHAARLARASGNEKAYTAHHDYAENHFASQTEHETAVPDPAKRPSWAQK